MVRIHFEKKKKMKKKEKKKKRNKKKKGVGGLVSLIGIINYKNGIL